MSQENCSFDFQNLVWKSEYATGLEVIDFQHKKLFTFLNHLIDAQNDEGENVALLIEVTLDELFKYTIQHFKDEEECMVKANYADLPLHLSEHGELKESVGELMNRYQTMGATLLPELILFLAEWIKNHILGSDMKYKDDLKKVDLDLFSGLN